MKIHRQPINWLRLFSWIVSVELIGIVSGSFTLDAIDSWYRFLDKPAFSPPNWLFGPVWIILYVIIGTVGYWLWHTDKPPLWQEKRLFIYQLILNGIWTPIFFGLRKPDWALAVIVGLWITLSALIVKLWAKQKSLALWLVPYLIWVSFASVLNFSIWWLN